MKCDELTNDVLADLHDGSLDEEGRREAEAHLAGCAACRKRAEEIRDLLEAASAWPEETDMPARVDRAVAAEIGRIAEALPADTGIARVPRPFLRILLPVAASLLLAVAGFTAGVLSGAAFQETPPEASTGARVSTDAAGTPPGRRTGDAEGKRLRETVERLREDLAAVRARRDPFREDLEKTRALFQEATGALRAVQGESKRLAETVAREREKAEAAGRERVELAMRVEALAGKLAGSTAQIEDFRTRVENLEKRNEDLDRDLAGARRQVDLLQRRNASLAERLEVPGDMNRDGEADVRDAWAICARLTEGEEVDFIEEADLNGDGRIDVADALLIAMQTAGGGG